MFPIARHQVSFTASFMIEVNEIRNRYLKLERQSHCLGCAACPPPWQTSAFRTTAAACVSRPPAPRLVSTSLEAAIDLYQASLAFCCHCTGRPRDRHNPAVSVRVSTSDRDFD